MTPSGPLALAEPVIRQVEQRVSRLAAHSAGYWPAEIHLNLAAPRP